MSYSSEAERREEEMDRRRHRWNYIFTALVWTDMLIMAALGMIAFQAKSSYGLLFLAAVVFFFVKLVFADNVRRWYERQEIENSHLQSELRQRSALMTLLRERGTTLVMVRKARQLQLLSDKADTLKSDCAEVGDMVQLRQLEAMLETAERNFQRAVAAGRKQFGKNFLQQHQTVAGVAALDEPKAGDFMI